MFQPTPTLESGLTVNARESCWTVEYEAEVTCPFPTGLTKDRRANRIRAEAKKRARSRREVVKARRLNPWGESSTVKRYAVALSRSRASCTL